MSLRKSLFGVLGTILACGAIAFAQERQPQTSPTQDETLRRERIERVESHRQGLGRREGREGRRGMDRRDGRGHLMRELNLSEEQRQQSRAIMQRRLEGTKSQREELFKLREKRIAGTFTAEDEVRAKALHQEIRTSMEGVRAEMAGVLTAEQKTRLEELQKERKARMELRMKEREERRQERLNNKPL
ncbi:MAG TPA: Spy/CpxP family protein refolding chaperone [Pyrinomonadaceae bacterium]|nr:Spy/CpxP family protein refolding chaperone [Pyrinomonadaceae bacterium]